MLFQTPEFLMLFLSVLAGLVLLRTQTLQIAMLVLASWIFYMFWDPVFIVLLLYCTVNDYALGIAIERASGRRRRFWLVVSLVTNLGVLAVFKYSNFAIDSINHVLHWLGSGGAIPAANIVLPVGISFYTFHSMGYNIDVYRGKTRAETSFLRFALYVAFFPQLVAGPILRAGQFLPQTHKTLSLDAEKIRSGAHLFLVGLVKKVIVADNVAPLVNSIFAAPQGLPSVLVMIGTFAFGAQIYCDFSGYTDMARGVSRALGYEIPLNFNYPYFSRTITDFWKRWHISLSSWLRDYLYIPLGGNRGTPAQTYRNLMLTMALGGLWHGASWNFLIWGVYQGGLLAIERFLGWGEPVTRKSLGGRLLNVASWLVCQYFVFLGWLIFRVTDSSDLLYCARKYVLFDFDRRISSFGLGSLNPFLVVFILGSFTALHFASYRVGGFAAWLDRLPRRVQQFVYVVAVFMLISLWPQARTAFIYFQF